MFVRKISPWFACVLLAASAVPLLPAAEIQELDRITPVPAGESIPIIDYFRPSLLERPKLNAPGTRFAAEVDLGDHRALLVCELATKKFNVLRGAANKDLEGFSWLDQARLLTSWTADKIYAEGLFVTDATDLNQNYAVETYSATALVGIPRTAPTKPLIWIVQNAYDEGRDGGVVQIDTNKKLGRNRDVLPGSMQEEASREEASMYGLKASIVDTYPSPKGGVVIEYLSDKDGRLAFAVTADSGVYTLHRLVQGKWLKAPVDLETVEIIGAGDRPDELIVVGPSAGGMPRPLQRLDASTGAAGEVLLQDKAYDAGDCALYRHPASGIVLGARFRRSQEVAVWFDESYRIVQKLVDASFPGHIVQILGSDNAEAHFLIGAYSDREPPIYLSLELRTRTLGLLKAARPWIDPARMQPMIVIKYKTRDEHRLEAYVTLPPGAAKDHPVPLIVLPHGGPWARDTWGFDSEVQFLVSRGYAVLQPNYRGSTGYDWMFPGMDQWAFRKMHDDVTSAVKALLGTGVIDPGRIAIMGTSFGGYLAACGAAFEPGLYRCAVTISGVFDWEQVMREAKYDQYSTGRFGALRRNLGDPRNHAAEFDAISPLRHVDQIKIPVFVAHGKEDNVADVSESRNLIAQLDKFQVPHESLIVAGEGHGMAYLKNQVALYTRIEAFLAKHLMPAKPAGTGTP